MSERLIANVHNATGSAHIEPVNRAQLLLEKQSYLPNQQVG